MTDTDSFGIAIIGLAGRFPESPDLEAFWELLKDGREAVLPFSDEELVANGADPNWLQHPNYVKAGAVVSEVDYFDADFFKMSKRDAEITDPQHRLFMECVWQAAESAGYPPEATKARIGLYAGVGENTYQPHYLDPNSERLLPTVGAVRLSMFNGVNFLATHTAYKLNITGPVMTVQTACSTSLVAIHLACQSLLNFECDLALAGGVSVFFPQGQGYLYQAGMVLSPDGHCRAFDARAQGTATGGGVGVVMLKRLDEAIADGDTIHAVILGSAINNDGADKIGFTAPSVSGQTDVVLEAQAVAGVHPDEISYIEAHGTGTPLGDPIEIQALTNAFRANTEKREYCAIGSVKTNIGHTDTAAGVAGLIKTVLALKHRQLPPSLNFERPNPQIDFANSPFFVNNRLRAWALNGHARRCAGINSLGMGGTNAHLILTEAPPQHQAKGTGQAWQLLRLSAKTKPALEKTSQNLGNYLQKHPDLNLGDVAYTLQVGRQGFAHRQILVCNSLAEAATCLKSQTPSQIITHQATEVPPDIIFMFPGGGAQYPNMGRDLYEAEVDSLATYREQIDCGLDILQTRFKIDLKPLLFPVDEGITGHNGPTLAEAKRLLERPSLAYPALFITEYALAQVWLAWGIKPTAMIGHSMGEYMAACLAGVFSLEDALAIVTWRGQLFETLPPGAMLSVYLSEAELHPFLTDDLAIAAINKHNLCTVSGPVATINQLAKTLGEKDIPCKRVKIAFAGHSPLQEPILAEFRQRLNHIRFSPPKLPFISNVTGSWISPQEATDPDYWVHHLRYTVRFTDGLGELLAEPNRLFLEVGPGQNLQSLVKGHKGKIASHAVLASLRPPKETRSDLPYILHTVGHLWLNGVKMQEPLLSEQEAYHRLPLPTYPFERQRCWIDAPQQVTRQKPQPGKKETFEQNVPPAPQPVTITQHPTQGLSPLEQKIAHIWSQSLGVTDLGAEADFFALGGDSLLATQVIARLQTELTLNLDTHSLLQAPTIAQLANLIATRGKPQKEEARLPELVVELQRGNPARKPLVLMHPVGGHVYFYRQLVRHLDPDLPVYGIRAQGVAGEAEPLTTMADMARVYTTALQALQPQGPYYLGGSSFGGTLAFAMAHKLVGQGAKVAFLGLIDTPSQGHMPEPFEEIADILFYMLTVGENAEIDLETLREMDEAKQLDFFVQQSKGAFTTPHQLKTMLKLFTTNEHAMWNYVPPPYPGKLHFFLARERDAFNAQTPAYGWIGLAEEGIEIYPVPGNHITINEEPNVQYLAKLLKQSLNELQD